MKQIPMYNFLMVRKLIYGRAEMAHGTLIPRTNTEFTSMVCMKEAFSMELVLMIL